MLSHPHPHRHVISPALALPCPCLRYRTSAAICPSYAHSAPASHCHAHTRLSHRTTASMPTQPCCLPTSPRPLPSRSTPRTSAIHCLAAPALHCHHVSLATTPLHAGTLTLALANPGGAPMVLSFADWSPDRRISSGSKPSLLISYLLLASYGFTPLDEYSDYLYFLSIPSCNESVLLCLFW